jgi:phosphoglycolate phosphatase-like HAD superfamily hydrolase
MADSLTPTLITVSVTALGWYATYAYTKHKEDRTRRLEIQLKYRAQQIEVLYGPLLSLIEQIFNVWQVRKNVLGQGGYSPDDQQRIQQFFWQRYFMPLHKEIGDLLRTRLYLLEGNRLPDSFSKYLEHSTQEASQHLLWDELRVNTSRVVGTPWPERFYDDVKEALGRLMDEHKSGVAKLS